MTRANYLDLLGKGYTGPNTDTCFPAALDNTSERHNVSASGYLSYELKFLITDMDGVNPKRTREMTRDILSEVGVGSLKGVSTKHSSTPQETEEILENARQGGRRVIVYTEDDHVVGLRPVNGGWRFVGNRTPVNTSNILESQEVHQHLAHPKERFRGKRAPNIVSLPPEPKKER